MTMILKVCLIIYYFVTIIIIIIIIITHCEITISGVAQNVILTIQPLTVPDRLKGGRCLRLKGCVVDAEEDGDQNTLGLSFIRRVEAKICTIN